MKKSINESSSDYRIRVRGNQYKFIHRKLNKRLYRKRVIEKVNFYVRNWDINYSSFVHNLSFYGVCINRNILAKLVELEVYSSNFLIYISMINKKD